MRIAFLGLGIMGSRMAANLATAGHELTVWNRTAAKAEQFAENHAATVAASPKAAAEATDLVITMVVDGAQVEQILLGPEGAADAEGPRLFMDCSTIGPSEALRIAGALTQRSHRFIDAPVTGSSPRAENGTLTFMVGADAEAFVAAEPAFAAMGERIVHCGPVGQGQSVKVINNAVSAINAAGLAQALLVAQAEGVDLDALVEVLGAGSGGSVMLELKAGPMRRHDYTPLFKLDHMLKDVQLCLERAADAGVSFPFAAQTAALLAVGSANGLGELDFAALIETLEADTGFRLQG